MLRETGRFYGYRAEQNGSDQNRRSKFKLSGGLREQGGLGPGAAPFWASLLHQGLPLPPFLPPSSLPEWKLFRFWLLRAGFLPRK